MNTPSKLEALDKIGSLYFTEEGYDDFYYGKGSTYPDVNGAVGILFENAGVENRARQVAPRDGYHHHRRGDGGRQGSR